jgi:uncharacterized protein (UPF0332 family)
MARAITNQRLNRIAKAKSEIINNWKEGVSLEQKSGKTISQLINQSALSRWNLAYQHRYQANKLMKSNPALYRSATSRYYYSMYHALRACIFLNLPGDDHEEHSKLPLKIPDDFPSEWKNKMKEARLTRNAADYDPFPKSDLAWKESALRLKQFADELISLTRQYLRKKGCKL